MRPAPCFSEQPDSWTVLSVINRSLRVSYQNAQPVIFNSKEIYPLAMNTVRNYSLDLTKERTKP